MTDKIKVYATPKKWVKTALAICLGLAVGLGTSFAYTNYVDRKSNQVWCDVINPLVTRYQKLPPNSDPDAIRFLLAIEHVKSKYHC